MIAEIVQHDGSNVITIRDGKVLIDTIEVSKLVHISDIRPGMPLHVWEDTCFIYKGTFFFLSRKGLREGIDLFAVYSVSEYSVRIGDGNDIYKQP